MLCKVVIQMNDKNFSADARSSADPSAFNGADRMVLDNAAAKNPQIASMLSKLSPADKQKLQNVLSDPEQTRRILATPQAQALLRSLQSQDSGEKH